MKDERIIELVNGELDGTNSPSEHSELASLLDREPSVKVLLDEMRKMDHLLATVPMVEPPAGLKSNVMSAIAPQEAPARAAGESWLDRILAPFIQRPAWAAAYAFMIGIVVGLGVFTAVDSTGPDSQMVQGTIGDLESTVLERAQIIAGDATADVVVSGLDGELRVDVTISSGETATLRITPAIGDPILIAADGGAPAYSVIIPNSESVGIELTSGGGSERALLTLDRPDE